MVNKEAFESWLSPRTLQVIDNFLKGQDGDGIEIANIAHLKLAYSWVNTCIIDDEAPDGSLYILQNITPAFAEFANEFNREL